jgi:hypothetical protein
MIHVIGQRELLAFEKVKPGDLVTFAYYGEKAIGIVLEFNEDREPLVGVLSSNSGLPMLLREDARGRCMTCGADWAIEPVETSLAVPGVVEVGRRAGLLALTSHGWLMNFAASGIDGSSRFKWEWWELYTLKRSNTDVGRAMLYDTWKIWAPITERDRAGVEPLISYHAVPTSVS